MRALLCALLLLCSQAQADECDFVNAELYSPGYNLPDIANALGKGLPFWCNEWDEMHNKNGHTVVENSDRYYSVYAGDCPCRVSKCCADTQFYCESALYHQFQWCYKKVVQCNLSPQKGLYVSGCGCGFSKSPSSLAIA